MLRQVNAAAAVATEVDWASAAKELDPKSPLEIMDHVRRPVLGRGR